MAARTEGYDAFVSYRRADPDATWVRNRLVPGLRQSGVRIFTDYDGFVLGSPLLLEMARAVETSRFTLAVLTPQYIKGAFAELESLMAQQLGLEQARLRLIGILREPCEPRLTIRVTLLLDMTRDDAFADQLRTLVAGLLRPE